MSRETKSVAPLNGCPVCYGEGEYHNERRGEDADCPCILMKESDEGRMEAMTDFRKALNDAAPQILELPSNVLQLTGMRLRVCLDRMIEVHGGIKEVGLDQMKKTHPTTMKWMEERGYDKLFPKEFENIANRTFNELSGIDIG